MKIKEIVKKYLIKNGYAGLCNYNEGCGCGIKDFMPCGDPNIQDCVPGHVLKCKDCSEWSDESCRVGYDYCIGENDEQK